MLLRISEKVIKSNRENYKEAYNIKTINDFNKGINDFH